MKPLVSRRPGFVVLAAVFAVVLGSPLAGERAPMRTLTTADGLPRDQLQCVHSDAQGFLWFCTDEGLVRFDGQVAVTFGANQGLKPAKLRSFLIANGGRYFAGADEGLFVFTSDSPDGGRFSPVLHQDGRRVMGVNAIIEARDQTIWCATGGGLLRLTQTASGLRLVDVDIGLPRQVDNDQIVRAVIEDEHGTLWIGATSGLYARDRDGRVTRITVANGLPANDVLHLAFDAERRLWAATREGLVLLDREAFLRRDARVVRRVFTERDGVPSRNVRAVHVDGPALWLATVSGIAEATFTARHGLRIDRTIAGFTAWAATTDRRGDIWVATESGARRIAREGFTIYSAEDGLTASSVSSIFETRDGQICATSPAPDFGLSCFDRGRFRPVPLAATRTIADIGWGWSQQTLQDRHGGWWIPTGEGLLRFAPRVLASLSTARPLHVYTQRDGLRSDNIFRLFEDSRDGIWVATFAEGAHGLARIDALTGAIRIFGRQDGIADDLPMAMAFAEDHSGSIWIGFDDGWLLRYRDGRFDDIPLQRRQPGEPRPTYEDVNSIVADRRGRVWIASTAQGLGRIDHPHSSTPTIKWHGKADGLSSETAWVVVEDASGDLFVGTGRGVDRFNPETNRFTYYSADEGVPRGEIRGGLRDRSGRIWLATTGGLALFQARGDYRQLRPSTLITAIRVAGLPLAVRADGARRIETFTVEPGDRRIEIDFVTPGARGADGVRYQHRLDGVDQNWTTTDARTVALAGAAPGRYRFLVRSIFADGGETEAAAVEFVVLAPLWRRPWFLALLLGAVSAGVLSLHRARVRHEVAVERVRSQIAADLHDGVGASLSRIAILSEVVRQQAQTTLPDAIPAIAAIGENARTVIDDMSDAVWFIDPRRDNLQQVVARVRALASELFDGQRIGWTVDAPAEETRLELTSEQRRHLYLILKESLTNVVRHARATHVAVRITVARGSLRLEVIDDGVGLHGQGGTDAASGFGGRGLGNLQHRAATLGGTARVTSQSQSRGTMVMVEVPVGRPHVHAVGSA